MGFFDSVLKQLFTIAAVMDLFSELSLAGRFSGFFYFFYFSLFFLIFMWISYHKSV